MTTEQTTGLMWFKSSYSGNQGGECVEVAAQPGMVHIRDSKSPGGPVINTSPGNWARFVEFAANHTA